MPLDVHLGDVVRLRKPHPCGGYTWEVVRLGADIGPHLRPAGAAPSPPVREAGKDFRQSRR